MKTWLSFFCALWFMPVCWAQVDGQQDAQQLLIVVSQHNKLQQISAAELRDVYFGVLTKREDLQQLQPIDAAPGAARDFFLPVFGWAQSQSDASLLVTRALYWAR